MSDPRGDDLFGGRHGEIAQYEPPRPIVAEVVAEPRGRRLPWMPLLLFLATCYTTIKAGGGIEGDGLLYAVPLLTILLCHEFGHYLQARRYHVPASLPYFIPMPIGPLGTMGAVIGMRGNTWDRRALFDIGITGPLAGLVPTLIFCVIGLQQSEIVAGRDIYGEPLLFQLLVSWLLGPVGPGQVVLVHPMAFAGWVGLFITALNLMPIGQLDGGHVLYALMRRNAHLVASGLLLLAIAAVIFTQSYNWLLMLFLLVLIGPNHPPTANDSVPLGTPRIVLGWLTLSFVIIGFTPRPFIEM